MEGGLRGRGGEGGLQAITGRQRGGEWFDIPLIGVYKPLVTLYLAWCAFTALSLTIF